MTSFGWKKKTPGLNSFNTVSKVHGKLNNVFENNIDDTQQLKEKDSEEFNTYESCTTLKKRKLDQSLENAEEKALRLKKEGIALAENEEYWQAIGRWDEAILLLG